MSSTTTAAPSAVNAAAIAAPRPDAPPVTSARRPVSCPMLILSPLRLRGRRSTATAR